MLNGWTKRLWIDGPGLDLDGDSLLDMNVMDLMLKDDDLSQVQGVAQPTNWPWTWDNWKWTMEWMLTGAGLEREDGSAKWTGLKNEGSTGLD